ncbi:MAG TPA: cbb3-type cytochrome c oxidase subunit I, partial [Pyrinomonadaceae bacterium]
MAESSTAHEAHEGVHRHEPPKSFIRKYVFSLDHKVIGVQYLALALTSVIVGMTLSVLMRMNLTWAGPWPVMGTLFPTGAPGGVMTPEFYLAMVTMHGTMMVFFVLTTAPQGGFGNYFLPIQIGADDMAFPVLNMLSFWVTLVGFFFLLAAFFVEGGAPIGGWTAYPPLSALGQIAGPGQGAGMNMWIISIAIFCVASLLGALN